MTDENVVSILGGKPATYSSLDDFIQDLGIKFQEHIKEEGCEPTIFYMAMTTASGPVYAHINTVASPEDIRSSEVEAKVFFHLQYRLTNSVYKI